MNSYASLEAAEAALARMIPFAGGLKPLQRSALRALAAGENVSVVLPTGYGKSLCFALPAAAWGWRVWVISPLVALMEDQAQGLRASGLRALSIHGSLSPAEIRGREQRLFAGEVDILWISPERLVAWERNGLLRQLRATGLLPRLLALDEVHCFEAWRGFRPGYNESVPILRRFHAAGAQVLGLTATIQRREAWLWMQEVCGAHRHLAAGLGRERLALYVLPMAQESQRWVYLLSALKDLLSPRSALIYCETRRECDALAQWLRAAAIPACAFHAGLPRADRAAKLHAFRRGRLRVICATSAFGMGIDYPHVDRVIHFSLPACLDSYWQEVGRAGRGGQEAWALAFWRRSEWLRARRLQPQGRHRFLSLWQAWAADGCRRLAVANHLQLGEGADCGNCDVCFRRAKKWPEARMEWREAFHQRPWWLHPAAQPQAWAEKKILQPFGNPVSFAQNSLTLFPLWISVSS